MQPSSLVPNMLRVIYSKDSWKTVTWGSVVSGTIVSIVRKPDCKKTDRDRFSVQLGEESYMVPPWSYVNHSCDPSCEIKHLDERYALVTKRCLEEGDEITFNYLENEDSIAESFDCKCGASNCVGKINQ